MSESLQDWLDDFSPKLKTDAELRDWADSLSGPENAELRQLIQEAQCMRWTARVLADQLRDAGLWPDVQEPRKNALDMAAFFVEARDVCKDPSS